MARFVLFPDEMKAWEKEWISKGVNSLILMENAAKNAAQAIMGREAPQKAFVFCGPGNNGGDGFAIARHLLIGGFHPAIILLCPRESVKGDALVNLEMAELAGVEIIDAQGGGWPRLADGFIVDAIFGTGINRNTQGVCEQAVSAINASGLSVYAVDIPSGIDGLGQVRGTAVHADVTVTFQYVKTGHVLYPGREYAGEVILKDIGIPRRDDISFSKELLDGSDIPMSLLKRRANTNKGDYGRVAVLAGSTAMAGAGALCARAALRCGCGLLTLGAAESLCALYHVMLPEAMVRPLPEDGGMIGVGCLRLADELVRDKSAVALGPGLGRAPGRMELLKAVIGNGPAVIDADGLNALSEDVSLLDKAEGGIVLTPHPGEMARLCGLPIKEILRDPVRAAADFASAHNAVVLLKGSTSIIASPEGKVTFNTSGNAGLAKGGSGDVLTGITAALLSRGYAPYEAARLGSLILGLAGDEAKRRHGENAMLAGDVIECLGTVLG